MNDIDQYAEWVPSRWTSKGPNNNLTLKDLFIMSTGLAGEAGELLEAEDQFLMEMITYFVAVVDEQGLGLAKSVGKTSETLKKSVRDDTIDKTKLSKELGDVFYYLCMICHMHNIKPSEVLTLNMGKIESRHERGVIHGNGDDR